MEQLGRRKKEERHELRQVHSCSRSDRLHILKYGTSALAPTCCRNPEPLEGEIQREEKHWESNAEQQEEAQLGPLELEHPFFTTHMVNLCTLDIKGSHTVCPSDWLLLEEKGKRKNVL